MARNKIDKIVNNAEESEKSIERYLVARVKGLNGICLKYSNPGMIGYPDRIVLLPYGVVFWVELKSKGKQLQAIQRERILQMANIGHFVHICDSREDVDNLIKDYHAI